MNTNKQGQTGVLTYFTLLLFFILFWAFYGASWLSDIGARAVTENSLTGFEAFAFANINLWVFLGVLAAAAIGVFSVGGSGQ